MSESSLYRIVRMKPEGRSVRIEPGEVKQEWQDSQGLRIRLEALDRHPDGPFHPILARYEVRLLLLCSGEWLFLEKRVGQERFTAERITPIRAGLWLRTNGYQLPDEICDMADLCQASTDADSSPPPPPKRKSGVPKPEANTLVRDWLDENARGNPDGVTIRTVALKTKLSIGGVQKTAAWRAFEAGRKSRRVGQIRTIPLSDRMQDVRPDDREGEPSEIAEQNEEDETIWNKILQQADSSEQRARLVNMPVDDRQDLIELFRQQRRDHAADRRERSRRS